MALNAARLSAALYAALTADSRFAFTSPLTGAQQDMLHAFCDAIANGVLAEIIGNAVVTASGSAGSVTGTVS
jgi:hypothetical protein